MIGAPPSQKPISRNVKENASFSQGIHCYVNYWEIKPTQYEARLYDLALKGVKTVSTFVPWAHFETDIHHSLRKFLRAVHDAKLQVRIFVMPAAGIQYPNAGIPKDLLINTSHLAVDAEGSPIHARTAPNLFPIPSFSSPEVLKAFGNHLLKLSSVLLEVSRETKNGQFFEVVITNGFCPYLRNPGTAPARHGDMSAANVIAYRDFLDREYRTSGEGAAHAERLKNQIYDPTNRQRYFTHTDRMLRDKTDMMFTKKQAASRIHHETLVNPEALPELADSSLLTEVLGFRPSVKRFYDAIVEASARGDTIHFAASGIFRRFTDQEKAFLLHAAFIHCGEVMVSAEDLFRLSASFQRKRQAFADLFSRGGFEREMPVTCFAASAYAVDTRLRALLDKQIPGMVRIATTLDAERPMHERLVICDPKMILRTVELVQLLSIAKSGKIVAIPAPMSLIPNYMADAADQQTKFRRSTENPLRINLGLTYEVHRCGLGQVIFYDATGFWQDFETDEEQTEGRVPALAELRLFLQAMLGLAEVQPVCMSSSTEIRIASFIDDSGDRLVCIVNPNAKAVDALIRFSQEQIVDAVSLAEARTPRTGAPVVASELELSVPPYGVIPMRVLVAGASDIAMRDMNRSFEGRIDGTPS